MLATDDEVRAYVSVEEMVISGASIHGIQRYYPETTPQEIKAIKDEVASRVTPFITNPPCNNINFYGALRGSDGYQWCFANAGAMNVILPGVTQLFRGNNRGQVLYTTTNYGNTGVDPKYYWSPVRGPVNPLSTCFGFSGPVTVEVVNIL